MTTSPTMDFSVEPAGPCRKRVSVRISPERVSEEFNKSYDQFVKTVPIPGFRQGKAPRRLVERKFGKQVAIEVKQTLLDTAFEEALKENDLAPIAAPEVDVEAVTVEPSKAVDFDFTVTVKPEFELPEYGDIEVSVPPAEPEQHEIDGTLKHLRKSKATLRPVSEGAIEADDVVNLKMRGLVGEEQALSHDNLPYEVGSRMLADLITDGLDEALIGKKTGDSVTAKAFVPPHAHNHPLAGAELTLEAEVVDHKRPDLPELDDDLAKSFDFESRQELVDAVKADVRRHKEQERDKAIEDLALAQLAQKAEFDLPEDLIERQTVEMAQRAAYDMQMRGESEEEIARELGEFRDRRREETAQELKVYFVLDKIVEKERILVPESEVREAVAQIAQHQNQTPEQMYAMLRDADRLGALRNQLRVKKARAKLRKKVKVTEAPAPKAPAAKKKKAATKKTEKKSKKES